MRRRWQIADFRAALDRHWRVRPALLTREELASRLEVHPLEERRVLSASAAVALAQALAASGMEQVEGAAKSPDPATPLGTDAAHQEPIDPGGREVPGQSPHSGNHSQNPKGPAAENLTESENRSVSDPTDVQVQMTAEPATQAAPAPLALEVAENQSVAEGTLLSITNIGTFTDWTLDTPTYTYSIDWGDGTPIIAGIATIDVVGGDGFPTEGSFDGAHTYADNGTYTVTVSISSDPFGFASGQFTVTVQNVAPTLTVVPNQFTNEGALLSITDIGTFTDPGFDNPLNVGGEVSETFFYSIDWGDGTPVDVGLATIDVAGGPGVLTQGSFNGSHTYADNGAYTVTVTINDDDGGSDVQTFTVFVNNVAPSLTVAPNQTVNEGALLSITNIGQITDPGFDNPLNVGGEVSETFFYVINWGDGTPVNVGLVTIDVPGGPGVPTQGSFDGSHIYADNGVYTVTVTVNDDDGGVAQQTFTVVVNNVAPTLVVAPDQVVDEGALLSIINIGQFTDPGFDNPNNVGGEVSETFFYTIDWGDGTPLNVGPATIDIPGGPGVPTQGSFDGSHIYADNGVYTVTVTVNDDDGGVAQQTFTVVVNNVAPTLVVAPDQVVDEGALLSIVNIGQFTDPGFDNPLNIGGEVSETFFYVINWGDGTPLDFGIAPIDVPGGPGVLTQGSFDGAHTYNAPGTYTVTVVVNDDDGGTAVGTFIVTVRSVAPILITAPNQLTNEGSLLSITNIGQFTDPRLGGSDFYTYSIDWGDGRPGDSGLATIDSAGAELPTLGSFDGAHVYADNGLYTVTVTVTTSDGRTAIQSLTVTVNNVAPTLVVGPNQSIPLGSILFLPNVGQFTDPGFDNLLNVGGETTERFVFAINWGDGTPITIGPATIDSPGAPGVLTAGSFDAQHLFASPGTFTVTVTLSDDDGGSAVGTFEVTVFVLRPPQDALFFPPGGGGGTQPPPPLPAGGVDPRVAPPTAISRVDFRGARIASVAGAEPRLVLRIVTPAGVEDRTRDETLPDEVLDNLRGLFKRLPDGHYRIYQIQPDGIERLVVDVLVRQGRSIELEPDVSPPAAPADQDAPQGAQRDAGEVNADEVELEMDASAAIRLERPEQTQRSTAALALGVAGVALTSPLSRSRRLLKRAATDIEPRPMTKIQRILRRKR